MTGRELGEALRRARALRRRWHAEAVAITLGAEGALLVADDGAPPLRVPAPQVADGDPCGAGDSLAVTAGRLLGAGASVEEAIEYAVAHASAFVAAGGAAAGWRRPPVPSLIEPPEPGQDLAAAVRLADRVRAKGGRVVATGGCFDLLHAGHVAILEAARALGDALIVLVNSDQSVRRLKGEGRPLNPASDRVRVLRSLRWVDAVCVFDEPAPVPALRELRPHLFVKGGDYGHRTLPEQAALHEWGGEVVLLPYVKGRSTSRLLKESSHAHR